jgi:hypothetical protein
MRTTVSLLVALCIPGGLQAQTSSVTGPEMQISPEIARLLLASMASDLRNLVTAREEYFSNNNRYGRTLSRTDRAQVFIVPSPGVTLTLTYVTTTTWAGRANHAWLPGISCVSAVGGVAPSRIPGTRSQGLTPREEGNPICDQP